MNEGSLGATFVAHAGRAAREHVALEEELRGYVDAARAAWPELAIDGHAFVRHVAERAVDGAVPPLAHAADLYLACACVHRAPGAADAFKRAHDNVIARVLTRRRASHDLAEDAAQTVYERLLVGASGAPPKIADYSGRGPLRSWVSTTAATTALMMHRAAGRRREDGEDGGEIAALAAQAGPELLYMKERYKTELADAVIAALARLPDRERTLLRLHLGEGMSIDRLGALYAVNRATAARWLSAAREALTKSAHDELKARGLSASECESIAALVRSELHVSIVRLLE